MKTDTKPSVIKALFFSLLALIVFYLLTQIIGMILILIYALLRVIPIVGDLIHIFFEKRGDGPEIAIPYIYLVFSYHLSISMLDRIVKSIPTRRLTVKLLGIYLIVLNFVFLFMNIVGDGAWGVNIGFIITGIVFMNKSGKYASVPTSPSASSVAKTGQSENVYYMEAANGMTVRVPESKLEAWQAEQERIRNDPKSSELTEQEKQFKERILREIYGPKSDNK